MKFYMELQLDTHDNKIDEGRIIVETQQGSIFGVHTSYADGFTLLNRRLPEHYLKHWCRHVTEQEAKVVMPELFAFLAKYGITDTDNGAYNGRANQDN